MGTNMIGDRIMRYILVLAMLATLIVSMMPVYSEGEFTPVSDTCLVPRIVASSPTEVTLDVSEIMRLVHKSPFVAGIIIKGEFVSSEVGVIGLYGSMYVPVNGSTVTLPPRAFDNVTLNRNPLTVSIRGASSISEICIDYYDIVIKIVDSGSPVVDARIVLTPLNRSLHSPVATVTNSSGVAVLNFLPGGDGYLLNITVDSMDYTKKISFTEDNNNGVLTIDLAKLASENEESQNEGGKTDTSYGTIAFYAIIVVLLVVGVVSWMRLRRGKALRVQIDHQT